MTDFKNQLYINGAWRDSASGAVFDVINPFDESVLSQCASAEVADAQDALTAAANAAPVWRGMTPRQRSVILRKAFDLMTARLPEFAELITLENGKAKTDAMGEATYAAEFFRWFSEEAVRADGNLTMAPASAKKRGKMTIWSKPTRKCRFSLKKIFVKPHGPYQSWKKEFLRYNLLKFDIFN